MVKYRSLCLFGSMLEFCLVEGGAWMDLKDLRAALLPASPDDAEAAATAASGAAPAASLDPAAPATAPKSPGDYYREADEHADALRTFWRDFLVAGLFVLAALVIFFVSLAWFAANNQVGATTSTISARGLRYQLSGAQGGAAGAYDRDSSLQLDTSDSIAVALNPSSNFNNASGAAGQIYPGARGTFSFTLTPAAADLHDVTITFTEEIVARTGQTADDAVATIKPLLKGHILFFLSNAAADGAATTDGSGYYSLPVMANANGTVALTIPSAMFRDADSGSSQTTKPVTITLYWVWPEQFSDLVLTGKTYSSQHLFAADGTSHQAFLDYLNTHRGLFYSTETSAEAASLPAAAEGMTSSDLQTCSNAYNAADELIGGGVSYVQVRLSTEEGDTSSEGTSVITPVAASTDADSGSGDASGSTDTTTNTTSEATR